MIAAMLRGGATTVVKGPFPSPRVLIFRGALALLFGLSEGALLLLAFRVSEITAGLLVWVLAGFVGLDGLATLLGARTLRQWPLAVFRGLIGVVAGFTMVFLPGPWVLVVFAWWALLTGLLELLEGPAASGGRAAAATPIALGLLLLVGVLRDGPVAILVVAAYGLVVGSLRLWAARHGAA